MEKTIKELLETAIFKMEFSALMLNSGRGEEFMESFNEAAKAMRKALEKIRGTNNG